MNLNDSSRAQTLGARRLPPQYQNNQFTDPKIQIESQPGGGWNNAWGDVNRSMDAGFDNSIFQFAANPMMRNVAGNIIKEQFAKQTEGVSSYFSFDTVRPYFDIDNMYIIKKLKLIFLPFLQKGDWKSENREDYMGSTKGFDSLNQYEQSADPYGVDLYLSIMSLITYALIVGFHDGALDIFDPASLSYTIGNCFAIWLIEAGIIKIIFAIQSIQNCPFLDLMCVSGYKFTSLIILYTAYIFGGSWIYYPTLIFIGISMSVFMIKTLKRYTHFNLNSQFIPQGTMTKSTLLYIVGGFQIPLLFLLGLC